MVIVIMDIVIMVIVIMDIVIMVIVIMDIVIILSLSIFPIYIYAIQNLLDIVI